MCPMEPWRGMTKQIYLQTPFTSQGEQFPPMVICPINVEPAPMKFAIAGTGYVGLSNAIPPAQHNEVMTIDIIAGKRVASLLFKKEKISC